jgi:hypothetical protein
MRSCWVELWDLDVVSGLEDCEWEWRVAPRRRRRRPRSPRTLR